MAARPSHPAAGGSQVSAAPITATTRRKRTGNRGHTWSSLGSGRSTQRTRTSVGGADVQRWGQTPHSSSTPRLPDPGVLSDVVPQTKDGLSEGELSGSKGEESCGRPTAVVSKLTAGGISPGQPGECPVSSVSVCSTLRELLGVGHGTGSLPPVSSAGLVPAPHVASDSTATLGSDTSVGDLLTGLWELVRRCELGGVRHTPATAWVPPKIGSVAGGQVLVPRGQSWGWWYFFRDGGTSCRLHSDPGIRGGGFGFEVQGVDGGGWCR